MKNICTLILTSIILTTPVTIYADYLDSTVQSHKITQREIQTARKKFHTKRNVSKPSVTQDLSKTTQDITAEYDKSSANAIKIV